MDIGNLQGVFLMKSGSNRRMTRSTAQMCLSATLVLFATMLLSIPNATAQEADHPCLTVATPEPMPSPTFEPSATPTEIPSPVASPEGATPVSFPSPTVDPGAVIAPDIIAVQEAIAACASEGDYAGMSTL